MAQFMEPEASFPHSQEPSTCFFSWSLSIQSIPPSYFSNNYFNIVLSFDTLVFQVVFRQIAAPKPCTVTTCVESSLRNLKVRSLVLNVPPAVPYLSQISPVLPTHLGEITLDSLLSGLTSTSSKLSGVQTIRRLRCCMACGVLDAPTFLRKLFVLIVVNRLPYLAQLSIKCVCK